MKSLFCKLLVLVFALPALLGAEDAPKPIAPEDPKLGRPVEFERDLYPILDKNCVACHNVVIDESKLVVEEVASILKGGKRGPAVVAGKPEESLLYQYAGHLKQPIMPPLPNDVEAAALTPRELGILKQWILEGAKQGASSGKAVINWQNVPAGVQSSYAVALDDHSRLAAVSRANRITVYDLPTQTEVAQLGDPLLAKQEAGVEYGTNAAHQDFVHALAFHPSGNLLASSGYRVIKLWERPQNVQLWKQATTGEANVLAIDAQQKHAAVGTSDNKIVLLSLADGKPVRELTGHQAAITGLAFSPDGTKLYSGSLDKKLLAWNVADGAIAGEIVTPAEIHAATLNKDGNKIVSAHQDNLLRVWDVPGVAKPAEGQTAIAPLVELKGHTQPATRLVAFPTDGNQVVSSSTDGTARLWRLDNGQNVRSITHGAEIKDVAISADAQWLLTAGADGVARTWQTNNGQKKAEVKGTVALNQTLVLENEALSVAKQRVGVADAKVKADEKSVTERQESLKKANEAVTAADKGLADAQAKQKPLQEDFDKAKAAFDAKTDDKALEKAFKDAETALNKENDNVKKAEETKKVADNSVKLSTQALKNSEAALVVSKQKHELTVKVQTDAEAVQKAANDAANASVKPLTAVAFSPDGRTFAAGGEDGNWNLWAPETGQGLESFAGHAGPITAAQFSSAGKVLTTSKDKSVVLWNTAPAWNLIARLGPPADKPLALSESISENRIVSLAFSHDGKLLASGGGEPSRNGELMLWDVEKKQHLHTFPEAHSDTVFGLDFSYDDKFLLSGAADKFAKLFNVETKEYVRSYEGHTHHVMDVALKADGSQLTTAGADNAIKVWNLETGEQIRTINSYSKQVTSLQYMGDTDQIASCGGDNSVRFHRTANGQNFRNFGGATNYQYAVAASRTADLVLATGEDGVLRVWNGTNGQVIATFNPPASEKPQQAAAK